MGFEAVFRFPGLWRARLGHACAAVALSMPLGSFASETKSELKSEVKPESLDAPLPAGVPRSCRLNVDTDEVKHLTCRFKAPRAPVGVPEVRNGDGRSEVDFLVLKGPLDATARVHGRLLAEKIASGVTRYVLDSKAAILGTLPAAERALYGSLLTCFVANYARSSPPEFLRLHAQLAAGLREAGVTRFTERDLLEMSFSVDVAGLVASLQRRLGSGRPADSTAVVAELAARCGVSPLVPNAAHLTSLFSRGDLWNSSRLPYAGCTGIAASGEATKSGRLLMARNVDSSALGYVERHPLVLLHLPPNGHAYVGVASPGLHYAGGSSGFNEKGLAVTLHAIGTDDLRTRFFAQEGVTAFYLQNEVLARASSIDEAFALVQSRGRFSGWAMVVGDAKTGEVASLEWTPSRAVVARRQIGGTLTQVNHFLAPEMKGLFVPSSFNKALESRARLARVERLLSRASGRIDVESLRELLGDAEDAFQGVRAFGRNVTKTYTTYSHVMDPTRGTFLLTLGDRLPVTRGRNVSFRVDFAAARAGVFPFQIGAPRDPEAPGLQRAPFWEASRGVYTQAFLAFRNGDDLSVVAALLENADALARKDGRVEFPYAYMGARIALRRAMRALTANDGTAMVRFQEAERLLSHLSDTVDTVDTADTADRDDASPQAGDGPARRLHPYDVSLVKLWLARARQLRLQAQGLNPREALADAWVQADLRAALALHETLLRQEPGDRNLLALRNSYWNAPRGRARGDFVPFRAEAEAKAPLDFVTVE